MSQNILFKSNTSLLFLSFSFFNNSNDNDNDDDDDDDDTDLKRVAQKANMKQLEGRPS